MILIKPSLPPDCAVVQRTPSDTSEQPVQPVSGSGDYRHTFQVKAT